MAAATDSQNRDEIWGQTGDKRGTQPPATPRTALQTKSQFVINARENTCFSDIVGILENTLVAEEGLEDSSSNHLKYRVGKLKVSNTAPNTAPKRASDASEPHSKREQQRMVEAAVDWLSGIEHIGDVATINPADLPW